VNASLLGLGRQTFAGTLDFTQLSGRRIDNWGGGKCADKRRTTVLGEIDRENPYTRMIIEEKVKSWLKGFPGFVTSNGKDKALFTKLTGITQAGLEKNWDGKDGVRGTKDDGRLTSCNSFAGGYSIAILGSKLKFSLAAFDLQKSVAAMGIPHAWKNQADDLSARPGFGDLVRWKRLHVGASLGFVGGKWHTIEGGKGGRNTGYDMVAQVEYDQYPLGEILGWVDFTAIYDHEPKTVST
jgi:hypothetical protein